MVRDINYKSEQRLLHLLFFAFGFVSMAWYPRFPEVKANLQLNNGAFGSLMSTGSIGAFFGLLTVGHIIHRFGAVKVTITSILILATSLGFLVHITTSFLFLVFNIAFGFGFIAVYVCINSQAFHYLERSGRNLVTSAAGYWSAGALVTAIVSGLLVGHVSLVKHIDILCLVAGILMIFIVLHLRPVLLTPNKDSESDYSIKEIFTSFRIDWPVSLGAACAFYLEYAAGDWGTIFTKERLNIDAGLSTVPYIVFTAAIIFGRLLIHRLLPFAPLHLWVKRAALLAGIGFGTCITKWWSYGLFIFAFFFAGLGSSFLGPTFFAAANSRSKLPSAVVVGQFGFVNNVLLFGIKWIVAWTIQLTGSIALAMMIPALVMLSTVFFIDALKHGSKAED
jgi:MFS family permease